MIRTLFFAFFVFVALTGCDKTPITTGGCTYTPSTIKASAAEITYIQNYLAAQSITATQDTSGFFYTISAPGSGTVTPNVCSTIYVQYTGWLFNGFKFAEDNTGTSFKLGGVIEGWQKSVPLIKPGGVITIYVPPSMGYGAGSTPTIPANSYLIFTIKLLAVQ